MVFEIHSDFLLHIQCYFSYLFLERRINDVLFNATYYVILLKLQIYMAGA